MNLKKLLCSVLFVAHVFASLQFTPVANAQITTQNEIQDQGWSNSNKKVVPILFVAAGLLVVAAIMFGTTRYLDDLAREAGDKADDVGKRVDDFVLDTSPPQSPLNSAPFETDLNRISSVDSSDSKKINELADQKYLDEETGEWKTAAEIVEETAEPDFGDLIDSIEEKAGAFKKGAK